MFRLLSSRSTALVAALVCACPALAQVPRCPPPDYDLESFKGRLVELAESPHGEAAIESTLANGVFWASCPLVDTALSEYELAAELIRWAAGRESFALNRPIHFAVRTAMLGRSSSIGRLNPRDALIAVVEEGSTRQVRGSALRTLIRLAGDDEIRSQLLEWAREERGPSGFEERPEEIALSVYYVQSMEQADLFRAELEADPSLIRNPQVRCWAEGRARPGQADFSSPERPPPCDR